MQVALFVFASPAEETRRRQDSWFTMGPSGVRDKRKGQCLELNPGVQSERAPKPRIDPGEVNVLSPLRTLVSDSKKLGKGYGRSSSKKKSKSKKGKQDNSGTRKKRLSRRPGGGP